MSVGKRRLGALGRRAAAVATIVGGLTGGGVQGQDLADFDYENLSFRGIGVEWGYLVPTRVENTQSLSLRVDLGYLGPGLRIVPSVGYWKAAFKGGEVDELERRVSQLVAREGGVPAPAVDLGVIDWSDVALALDAHVVWSVPYDVLTFAGVGAAAHVFNGDGAAVNGTFVEDLLDSVTAGFNLHAGLEYPVTDRVRLTGQGRYEVLGDLQYFQLRTGVQLMTGALVPGEERSR